MNPPKTNRSTPSPRQTAQRNAIEHVIAAAAHPLSVEEILQHGEAIVPTLGIATVYREIKRLVENEQIVAVQLPGGAICYERVGKAHHHHFRCDACGAVFDLDGCVGDFRTLLPKGFQLRSHELFLYGQCERCATA